MALQHACQINARPKSRGQQKNSRKFPLDQKRPSARQAVRTRPQTAQSHPLKLLGQVIVTEVNCHSIFGAPNARPSGQFEL
jgi:hypothetical protein